MENKSKLTKLITLAIALAVAFILGRVSNYDSGQATTNDQNEAAASANSVEVRAGGSYKYINPLLECNQLNDTAFVEFSDLKTKLAKKIESLKKSNEIPFTALYFRDLNNGPWIGFNERELFRPASLAKVPILIAYLKLAESSPSLMQKELELTQFQDVIQFFKGDEIEPGKKYTVEELLARMIRFSDNRATQLLSGSMSDEDLLRPFYDLGITPPNPTKDFEINVKNYAAFFRVLFNASYLDRKSSEKALELLTKTDFKKGIIASVPEDTVVAHKFGERETGIDSDLKQLHDCGIVYYPKHPYLICIMTRGKNFEKLAEAIRDLSKTIYDDVNQNIKGTKSSSKTSKE